MFITAQIYKIILKIVIKLNKQLFVYAHVFNNSIHLHKNMYVLCKKMEKLILICISCHIYLLYHLFHIIIQTVMNQIKTIFFAKKSMIKPNFLTFDRWKQKENFIERPVLSDQIKNRIKSLNFRNGVHVFWSPHGSGKTTLMKNIINRFNSNEHYDIKMMYINGANSINEKYTDGTGEKVNHCSIYNLMSSTCCDYIASNLDTKFTFVIDDYDLIYDDQNKFSEIYSNACSIAESSSNYGFKTILVVNDAAIAANILRFNLGEKFSTFNVKDYSWTREQINNFIERELMKPLDYNKNPPNIKKDIVERIYQLGNISKNPLFIKNLISMHNANNYSCVIANYINNNLNDLHNPIYDEMAKSYEKQFIIGSKFFD